MNTNSDNLFIKKLRNDLGLNQTKFASKIGVSLRTIQNWEGGKRNIPEWALKNIENLSKTLKREEKVEALHKDFELTDEVIDIIESAILLYKDELLKRSDLLKDLIQAEKLATKLELMSNLKASGRLK